MWLFPRRLLRSKAAWRLSGLTYRTAVSATHGRYVEPEEYLSNCGAQMTFLKPFITSKMAVLELGCGIGGNLLGLAPFYHRGVGLDINRGYVKQAQRLASMFGATNASFSTYNGLVLPFVEIRPQVIFSIGVFERLTKEHVVDLIRQLTRVLSTGGIMALYFLAERARDTKFTARLGSDAYVFWTSSDIDKMIARLPGRLAKVEEINWEFAEICILRKEG